MNEVRLNWTRRGSIESIPFAKGAKRPNPAGEALLGTGVPLLLLDSGLDLFPHTI